MRRTLCKEETPINEKAQKEQLYRILTAPLAGGRQNNLASHMTLLHKCGAMVSFLAWLFGKKPM